MHTLPWEEYIMLIKQQISPAVGCTEPAAVAYAAALAAEKSQDDPMHIHVCANRNILKNAMGVGIPGTDCVGLPIAAALGAISHNAKAELAVLSAVTPDAVARAKGMVESGVVTVSQHDTTDKIYISVTVIGNKHSAEVIIREAHTRVTCIKIDDEMVFDLNSSQRKAEEETAHFLTVEGIDQFIREVDWNQLSFLKECIQMNEKIASEGLEQGGGLGIGQLMWRSIQDGSMVKTAENMAVAMTCAASDARMSGSMLPVMASCGSGNQGLTATLPIIAAARFHQTEDEMLYRSLAYSLLITIHVKYYLGKLSAICACSIGASIGTACALTFMAGGCLEQICSCIDNLIADLSGIICDGAKAGCSLKIASGISGAFLCSKLAMQNHSVTALDGIVCQNVENSIRNLGILGKCGMSVTDQVILDMLVNKKEEIIHE